CCGKFLAITCQLNECIISEGSGFFCPFSRFENPFAISKFSNLKADVINVGISMVHLYSFIIGIFYFTQLAMVNSSFHVVAEENGVNFSFSYGMVKSSFSFSKLIITASGDNIVDVGNGI